jgi:lysozyme
MMMISQELRASLRAQLAGHEDVRAKPYVDTAGKVTIGIGRNLTDVGLTEDEIELLFRNDTDRVWAELQGAFLWFPTLDEVRQRVLFDMCFNLGLPRLRGFRRMLAAVAEGDYHGAAAEMLASEWAHQVGRRAVALASMMAGR